MVIVKDQEFVNQIGVFIKENGNTANMKDMELQNMPMENHMQEIGLMIEKKDLEYSLGRSN